MVIVREDTAEYPCASVHERLNTKVDCSEREKAGSTRLKGKVYFAPVTGDATENIRETSDKAMSSRFIELSSTPQMAVTVEVVSSVPDIFSF